MGVVKLAPVPTWFPAYCASYHLILALEQPEAVNVTVPPVQFVPPVVVGGAGGFPVTFNVAILLKTAVHPLEVTLSLKYVTPIFVLNDAITYWVPLYGSMLYVEKVGSFDHSHSRTNPVGFPPLVVVLHISISFWAGPISPHAWIVRLSLKDKPQQF
jgi:hypothetical protein